MNEYAILILSAASICYLSIFVFEDEYKEQIDKYQGKIQDFTRKYFPKTSYQSLEIVEARVEKAAAGTFQVIVKCSDGKEYKFKPQVSNLIPAGMNKGNKVKYMQVLYGADQRLKAEFFVGKGSIKMYLDK